MAHTHDGRTFLKGAAITAGALVGGLIGGAWWFVATFTISAEGPTRSMRVEAAEGLAGAAVVVLVLGVALAQAVRAPRWCFVPVVATGVVLAASAAYQLSA